MDLWVLGLTGSASLKRGSGFWLSFSKAALVCGRRDAFLSSTSHDSGNAEFLVCLNLEHAATILAPNATTILHRARPKNSNIIHALKLDILRSRQHHGCSAHILRQVLRCVVCGFETSIDAVHRMSRRTTTD